VRFIIIAVPPPQVQAQIQAIRQPLNTLLGSKEALRYPPHVTLRTGIICPDALAADVARAFLLYAQAGKAVPVRSHAVFTTTWTDGSTQRALLGWKIVDDNPQAGVEGIQRLHQFLLGFKNWAKGLQQHYAPHLTLAFYDIDSVLAERGKATINSDFSFAWTIDEVALYHENPDGWTYYASTALSN